LAPGPGGVHHARRTRDRRVRSRRRWWGDPSRTGNRATAAGDDAQPGPAPGQTGARMRLRSVPGPRPGRDDRRCVPPGPGIAPRHRQSPLSVPGGGRGQLRVGRPQPPRPAWLPLLQLSGRQPLQRLLASWHPVRDVGRAGARRRGGARVGGCAPLLRPTRSSWWRAAVRSLGGGLAGRRFGAIRAAMWLGGLRPMTAPVRLSAGASDDVAKCRRQELTVCRAARPSRA